MYKLKIKESRLAAGYSQAHMASLLHISKSYYSDLENGKYPIKLSTLCKIGEVLDIDVHELFITEKLGSK
ncbi:helix-turn-helix domain-containing protein [uncultured Clostridium sp.]|uniref:helix-turn-helix domain-containing protein n=1 Tax=uncultured Clostridium sp. TaxID=59620 RepID=UPI00262A57ED|nr:helix-turn-helix transcriptional regulator [uncultured Clostridium sp.]